MRFAFLGRVSTEDVQVPENSRQWQLALARRLIEPYGHTIVAEFFDVGQSRSVPWVRRPRASELLKEIERPDRRFDAVVVGEPQRAFSGSQFQMTFPVLDHYDVELWVPEVGGRVDPESEAHEIVMSFFGGMAEGERTRIRKRTQAAMHEMAAHTSMRLGGRPPYGYRPVGPHPNPAKAAAGARAHMLELDPVAAPVVRRIFDLRAGGAGYGTIAHLLQSEGVPSPSMHDPTRNSHHPDSGWGNSTIKAILENHSYQGVRVWGRTRKQEVLLDVHDVTLGYESTQRRLEPADWIVPEVQTHPAIITPAVFDAVQERRKTRQAADPERELLLLGRIRCAQCGSAMGPNNTRNKDRPGDPGRWYYRCNAGAKTANRVIHEGTRTVSINAKKLTCAIDRSLTDGLSSVAGYRETIETEEADLRTRILALQKAVADGNWCLETGDVGDADERGRIERECVRQSVELRRLHERLDVLELPATVEALADTAKRIQTLDGADDEIRRAVYTDLGLQVSYDGATKTADCVIAPFAQATGPRVRSQLADLHHRFTCTIS